MQTLAFSLDDIDRLSLLGTCLTTRRLDILREIVRGKKRNFSELASVIKIDRAFLTQTVQLFHSLGLISVEQQGREKFPVVNTRKIVISLDGNRGT